MADSLDPKARLRTDILAAYEDEHARLVDTWKGLESKAQATVAVAGIFIGGALALAKDAKNEEGVVAKIAILLVTVTLSAAVVSAVMALKVRDLATAPGGDDVGLLARDLLALPDGELSTVRMEAYLGDRARAWHETNRGHADANEKKAKWIARAQLKLLGAIGVASFLVAWTLFISGSKSEPHSSTEAKSNEVYQLWMFGGGGVGEQLLRESPADVGKDASRPGGSRKPAQEPRRRSPSQ